MCKLLSIDALLYSKTMVYICAASLNLCLLKRTWFIFIFIVFSTFWSSTLSFACQLLFVSFVASDDVQCA